VRTLGHNPDEIVLRRPDLDCLPQPSLPPGYTLRAYRDGDQEAWGDLYAAAFAELQGMHELPRNAFLDSPLWRPDRVRFACADDVPVACAAAWEDAALWGPRVGQVHWVATHPAYLRLGLARACVVAALDWMRGHYDSAALITQTFRVPAIRLYVALGFVPSMEAFADMPARWAKVGLNQGRKAPLR